MMKFIAKAETTVRTLRNDISFSEYHLNLFRSITSTFSALPTSAKLFILSGICFFVSFLIRTFLNKPTKKPTKKCFRRQYSNNDVLAERGSRANNHPGNKYYVNLVGEFAPRYIGNNDYKNGIAENILTIIESKGGRFLKRNELNQYCQMEKEDTIKKIMQRLRDEKSEQEKERKKEVEKVPPLIDDDDEGTNNFTAHDYDMNATIMCGGNDKEGIRKRRASENLRIKCGEILNGLQTHKYGWVFNTPVDPIKLEIPDYFDIIKKPMDLGTIEEKLDGGNYHFISDFASDIKLTFENAMIYNKEGSDVYNLAEEFMAQFLVEYKKLESYLVSEEVLDLLEEEPEGQDSHSLNEDTEMNEETSFQQQPITLDDSGSTLTYDLKMDSYDFSSIQFSDIDDDL